MSSNCGETERRVSISSLCLALCCFLLLPGTASPEEELAKGVKFNWSEHDGSTRSLWLNAGDDFGIVIKDITPAVGCYRLNAQSVAKAQEAEKDLDAAKKKADAAGQAADATQKVADDTQTVADKLKQEADGAKKAADDAKAVAVDAVERLRAADDKGLPAAKTRAETAGLRAAEAEREADEAKKVAGNAQRTADDAKKVADDAQKAAIDAQQKVSSKIDDLKDLDQADFSLTFSGEEIRYEIEITANPTAPSELGCDTSFSKRTYKVVVKPDKWAVAFAGAFSVDDLVSKQYYLEEGTHDPDPTVSGDEQTGFFVRRSRDAEDSFTLGAAAMVHVTHTRKLGWWAPVSFGLGINQNSNARYYLGTSLRFEKDVFLTLGVMAGSVQRLPNSAQEGSFTADSQLLANMGNKTDQGMFLAVSFSFNAPGKAAFGLPTETPTPK